MIESREAVLLIRDAGISNFKGDAIGEAEMLATINAPKILFAYPPIGLRL